MVVECFESGGKLRVRVVSEGYDPTWNCQFPKALREPSARYVVEAVHASKSGGFYRAYGDIKKLVGAG